MDSYGIVSLSGGQGKTTTAFFLGLHLAGLGRKVLWVDTDPQHNLTLYSGIQVEEHRTLQQVYRGQVRITDCIYATSWSNLFIIPANNDLAVINEYLSSTGNGGKMLARRLKGIRDYFDICIIDAPPSRSQIVVSVVGASQKIIIPFEVTVKGTNCLIETIQFLENLADVEVWNGEVLGVLPFRDRWYGYHQLRDAKENMEAVESYLNQKIHLFPAILESAQYRTAIRQGQTLSNLGYPQLDLPFVHILEFIGVRAYAPA